MLDNKPSVIVRQIKTILQHQSRKINLNFASPKRKHFSNMGVLKIEFSLDFVVLLVKRSPGNKYLDVHRVFFLERSYHKFKNQHGSHPPVQPCCKNRMGVPD